MKLRLVLLYTVMLLPLVTFAHPGHGHFTESALMHYITSPLHLISILLVVVVGFFFFRRRMIKQNHEG